MACIRSRVTAAKQPVPTPIDGSERCVFCRRVLVSARPSSPAVPRHTVEALMKPQPACRVSSATVCAALVVLALLHVSCGGAVDAYLEAHRLDRELKSL